MMLDGLALCERLHELELALDKPLVEAKHAERVDRAHTLQLPRDGLPLLIKRGEPFVHRLLQLSARSPLGSCVDLVPRVSYAGGEAPRLFSHVPEHAPGREGVGERRDVAQWADSVVAVALHPEASEAAGLLLLLRHQHGATHVLILEHRTGGAGAAGQARHDVLIVDDAKCLSAGVERLEELRELAVAYPRRAEAVHCDLLPLWQLGAGHRHLGLIEEVLAKLGCHPKQRLVVLLLEAASDIDVTDELSRHQVRKRATE
mmetsp:Transcript_12277/g.31071  ORF Transcript_12277/g.31071 Transcript_12277/m.31071 type:complete len:260 (-) Transcript_12277:270-1049(-)